MTRSQLSVPAFKGWPSCAYLCDNGSGRYCFDDEGDCPFPQEVEVEAILEMDSTYERRSGNERL